jgi:hypothetical protein
MEKGTSQFCRSAGRCGVACMRACPWAPCHANACLLGANNLFFQKTLIFWEISQNLWAKQQRPRQPPMGMLPRPRHATAKAKAKGHGHAAAKAKAAPHGHAAKAKACSRQGHQGQRPWTCSSSKGQGSPPWACCQGQGMQQPRPPRPKAMGMQQQPRRWACSSQGPHEHAAKAPVGTPWARSEGQG